MKVCRSLFFVSVSGGGVFGAVTCLVQKVEENGVFSCLSRHITWAAVPANHALTLLTLNKLD